MIDIICKTVKPSHLKKSKIIQKIKIARGNFDIFWLNFNKANHSRLCPFCPGGHRFSKNSTWSFDCGTRTSVIIHRFNSFCEHHKLKNFCHTWWNIQDRENSTSILERVDYQFVGPNLGVEIFLKKREHHKKGVLK